MVENYLSGEYRCTCKSQPRLLSMVLADLRFLWKYGFCFIYLFFTLVYAAILMFIPAAWRSAAAVVMIFSDPAAMGLFFMGAMILLEKNDKVLQSITVSPVRKWEYIVSKMLAFLMLSMVVAAVLILLSGSGNIGWCMLGTAAASLLFTMIGIIVGTKITTLNQYLLILIPVEVFCCVPPLLTVFPSRFASVSWLRRYPASAMMRMIMGETGTWAADLAIIAVTLVAAWVLTALSVKKFWKSPGGAKL